MLSGKKFQDLVTLERPSSSQCQAPTAPAVALSWYFGACGVLLWPSNSVLLESGVEGGPEQTALHLPGRHCSLGAGRGHSCRAWGGAALPTHSRGPCQGGLPLSASPTPKTSSPLTLLSGDPYLHTGGRQESPAGPLPALGLSSFPGKTPASWTG